MSLRFSACEIQKPTLRLPLSPPQPKERRKGKKEIHRANLETLAFYRKFSIAGTVSSWGEASPILGRLLLRRIFKSMRRMNRPVRNHWDAR